MTERSPLFSLTRKDFRWDRFRAGGKGGQKQNKVESGVRCVHEPSGAVGTARDSRNQHQNKLAAFLRCVKSKEFADWHKLHSARMLGKKAKTEEEINRDVDESMREENLKIETFDPKGERKGEGS